MNVKCFRKVLLLLALVFGLNLHAADLPSPAQADEVAESTNATFNLPPKDSSQVQWWRDSRTNLDERLEWWRDARFGMFIHWGVYSGLGNEFEGRMGGGYAEHIQRVLKIPIAEYREKVAGNFNPTNFNADAWVALAKQAGMKYIVITAKHHDGFAMWPAKVNDYNIMDATPWHHDPMADLRAACDRQGIKFGFYYSHAFDWGNSNAPGNDWDFKNPGGDKHLGGVDWWETRPEFTTQARKYVDEKAIPQIRELIKLYHPDILWFDTPGKLPPSENLRILRAVRTADPHVVISGRLVHGWGDYDDTTDRPANFPPHEGDWEGIPTTDESYGWNKFDTSHKPPAHFIQLVAKSAARGGNLLLNIGPMGDGNIDPKDVAILQGIGDWWRVNGQSIRGTTRTPLPLQTWGESTRKGNTLYLHVFNWPTNGELIVGGLRSDVKTAAPLAGLMSSKLYDPALAVTRLNATDVRISVPNNAPDKVDSVIVLQCAGDIQADTNRLLQPSFPLETLRAFDAELHGKGLRYGPGKKTDDVVQNWTKTDEYVAWPVRLEQAVTYEVAVNYAAAESSAGNTFTVSFGAKILHGQVKPGTDQTLSLGRVALTPGTFEIKAGADRLNGGELWRLRRLELRPVISR
ncbi:MAG TPA: alpha-L-fucosidase [Verrucomicrobiae bacterium]|nr:alpha-L-fucosidase [Verrucomicrobiae bacterium]